MEYGKYCIFEGFKDTISSEIKYELSRIIASAAMYLLLEFSAWDILWGLCSEEGVHLSYHPHLVQLLNFRRGLP